jgi:hypothetical protein
MFFNNLIKSKNISFVKTLISFSVALVDAKAKLEKDRNDSKVKTHMYVLYMLIWMLCFIQLFIGVVLLYYHHHKRLETKEIHARIDRLYVDVHVNRSRWHVMYYPFFFLKRFFYIVIPLLFFVDMPIQQTISIIVLNLVYFAYYVSINPHFG